MIIIISIFFILIILYIISLRNSNNSEDIEYGFKICELTGEECIHTDPDGLDNCRYCEEYDFVTAFNKGLLK